MGSSPLQGGAATAKGGSSVGPSRGGSLPSHGSCTHSTPWPSRPVSCTVPVTGSGSGCARHGPGVQRGAPRGLPHSSRRRGGASRAPADVEKRRSVLARPPRRRCLWTTRCGRQHRVSPVVSPTRRGGWSQERISTARGHQRASDLERLTKNLGTRSPRGPLGSPMDCCHGHSDPHGRGCCTPRTHASRRDHRMASGRACERRACPRHMSRISCASSRWPPQSRMPGTRATRLWCHACTVSREPPAHKRWCLPVASWSSWR